MIEPALTTAEARASTTAKMVFNRAQSNPDNKFDYAQFFRDSTGKLSMGSQISFLCFFVMAWSLLYATMNLLKSSADIDAMFQWYVYFGLIFAGTPMVSKLIDILPTLLALWKGVPPPPKVLP